MTHAALPVNEGDRRKQLESRPVRRPTESFGQPTIEPTEMFYRTAKQKVRGFAHGSQTSPRSGSVQMGQSPTGNVVRRPRCADRAIPDDRVRRGLAQRPQGARQGVRLSPSIARIGSGSATCSRTWNATTRSYCSDVSRSCKKESSTLWPFLVAFSRASLLSSMPWVCKPAALA